MKTKKIRIAILFGGRSAEHEVSIQSARNIVEAIDHKKYDVSLIRIDKKGAWHGLAIPALTSRQKLFPAPNRQSKTTALISKGVEKPAAMAQQEIRNFDVVFPILHGPFGEDGTMQGLLKLANVPFVGAGVLGSAVGMDKDVMKRLLRDAGIPIARFVVVRSHELPAITFEKIQKMFGAPFFIKPANLGSSVGVSKVHSKKEFLPALTKAFAYDTKILIEENIKAREIECSVLGNEHPIASVPGEIIPEEEFYSYEAKYSAESKTTYVIPAKLPNHLIKKIQELAIKTFTTLECEGMARVDFFLMPNNKIFVNEINTIPGFTKISMYPKLWEASGISYQKLIDTLITLAIRRFKKEDVLKTSYE
jgi:D-alanine-D-alanine ligase